MALWPAWLTPSWEAAHLVAKPRRLNNRTKKSEGPGGWESKELNAGKEK